MLYGCGGGESDSESFSDSGSLSFRLVWEVPSDQGSIRQLQSPSGDVCVDYGIETVNVALANSAGATVASASWPCSAHQGTLSNVPVGSGMTLTIIGVVGGNEVWRNQISSVSVSSGQNTDLGEVEMIYQGDDTNPPSVASHYPAPGATGVFLNPSITVTFSENVVAASVDATSCSVTVTATSSQISCTVSYESSTRTATITPVDLLSANTIYTVTITTAVEDLAGNHMASDESWSFTTGSVVSQPLMWDTGNWDETVWN
jgi:hypothetical protein